MHMKKPTGRKPIKAQMAKQDTPVVDAREPLLNEVEHFISCIKNDAKPLTGIDSSYAVTEWLYNISKSVKKA